MHIHCRNSAQRQGTFEKQGLYESKLILSHRSLLRGEVLLKGVRGWQCLFQPPFLKISSHKPVFSIFDTQTWSYGRERTTDWSPGLTAKVTCLFVGPWANGNTISSRFKESFSSWNWKPWSKHWCTNCHYVFIFLSNVFFSPQATFKPLMECVSPVGHILKRLIPSVFASPAYLPICLIAADFEEIKNPLSHLI